MRRDIYFLKVIANYMKRHMGKSNVNQIIQNLYNKYGYGYDEMQDEQLLTQLQSFNMSQDIPLLATGQSGYFHDQIMRDGLGNMQLNPEDLEDAKFISSCFGKNITISDNGIPITYTTLLGTTEFNYATQTFPAGIFEDVFQCSASHNFPIQPIVGESEQDFYLRLLEHQIDISGKFDMGKKQEALARGKRLISNFCKHKNKVYLIKLSDVEDLKASFGDVDGLRDGKASGNQIETVMQELDTLSNLLLKFNINSNNLYSDPNMDSEYGIALYGNIPSIKIQYIEVASKYYMLQKRAMDMGYKVGDVIPLNFETEINNSMQR